MRNESETSPVSHKLQVNRLPAKGRTVTIEADAQQRDRLARLHGLLSVERFVAELLARPWKGDGVRVTGHVEADITQTCIVSLEPLESRVHESVEAIFVPEGSRLARMESEGGEIVVEAESADLPEPFVGDRIDVGALAEEFFSLGIDPFPRKPGAVLTPANKEEDERPAGPLYDALKKLRGSG